MGGRGRAGCDPDVRETPRAVRVVAREGRDGKNLDPNATPSQRQRAAKIVPMGQGDIDYKTIFAKAKLAGMKYFVIEQDGAGQGERRRPGRLPRCLPESVQDSVVAKREEHDMTQDGFSRRYFFYGSLLAGMVPARGFGSVPSLKLLGYKSPNEKLNLAAIGAGGQPFSDLRNAVSGVENVVALADVDWQRGKRRVHHLSERREVQRFPPDARQIGQGYRCRGDRTRGPHARHLRAGVHAIGQARVRREAADPDSMGGAAADPGGGEVSEGGHPDGESGLLS